MASSKNRERALARAKVERQIARRAAMARQRRRWQAAIGAALAIVLVSVGTAWALGAFEPDPPKPDECTWAERADATNPDVKNVGTPPTKSVPRSGVKTVNITTNLGELEAVLDLAKAPCTNASFSFLAEKKFFNDTKCHRLTTEGIFVLQCGDPSGSGSGGPSYQFPDENLPVDPNAPPTPDPSVTVDPASASPAPEPTTDPSAPPANLYPRGTLAMANSGPGTNGSQFFIVYKDGSGLDPNYTVFGVVTKGLDLIDKVAADGVTSPDGTPLTDGAPKTEVQIQSLTVSDRRSGDLPVPSTPSPGTPTSSPPATVSPGGSRTPSSGA